MKNKFETPISNFTDNYLPTFAELQKSFSLQNSKHYICIVGLVRKQVRLVYEPKNLSLRNQVVNFLEILYFILVLSEILISPELQIFACTQHYTQFVGNHYQLISELSVCCGRSSEPVVYMLRGLRPMIVTNFTVIGF